MRLAQRVQEPRQAPRALDADHEPGPGTKAFLGACLGLDIEGHEHPRTVGSVGIARRMLELTSVPRSSPCPELERRARESVEQGAIEVEPDSGPVSRRGVDVAVDLELFRFVNER